MREPLPELIGRASELARLQDVVDALEGGVSSFTLLVGEAGIGKTRLLHAAREIAEARGLRVLRGTAIESGAALAYLPLLGPLSDCLTPTATDPASRLVRTLREGEPPAAGRSSGATDVAAAARLVEAVYEVLTAQPTLLLVDDVQWADASTLAVLDYLSHRGDEAPIAVLAAARNDEGPSLDRLPIADGRRFVPLHVRRLDRDEVGAQVATLLGAPPSQAYLDEVFGRTLGNPFFVEQVTAELAPGEGGAEGVPPPQLRALVLARVARLSRGGRSAVEALMILGRPADDWLIAMVADVTIEAVREPLREGQQQAIIVAGDGGYQLRHPVFGEVVRAEVSGPARAAMHRRAAEALAGAGGDVGAIAEHWWRAGDRAHAWIASLAAADAAARTLGFPEVQLHLERALELWPPGEPGRAGAALRAARAAWISGDAAAGLQHARAAEAHLEDDPGIARLEVLLAQGALQWDVGDRRASVATFDRVGELITDETPPGLRGRALWGLGRARVGEGRTGEAYELAMSAASFARQADDHIEEAEDLLLAGMCRAFENRIDGISLLERGRQLALEAGSPATVGHAYQFVVDLVGLSGDIDLALATALEGVQVTDRLGLARSHAADLRGRAALLLLEVGRQPEAAAVLRTAATRAFSELARARIAMRAGDRVSAEAALGAAATSGAIGGPGSLGGWAELTRVELASLYGEPDQARAWLARVPAVRGIWGVDVDAWSALWAARLGDDGDTAEWLAAAGRHPDRDVREAMGAEIEAISGAAAWSGAVGAWAAARRPYEECRALGAWAEAQLVSGDRAAGVTALQAALDLADRLGAVPLSAAARDLARRARISTANVRRRRPDPTEPTARELEVLRLLADGLTNPQIAGRLFLSPKTVGIHVSRILAKLDAHTRGEAVAIARRRDLLREVAPASSAQVRLPAP